MKQSWGHLLELANQREMSQRFNYICMMATVTDLDSVLASPNFLEKLLELKEYYAQQGIPEPPELQQVQLQQLKSAYKEYDKIAEKMRAEGKTPPTREEFLAQRIDTVALGIEASSVTVLPGCIFPQYDVPDMGLHGFGHLAFSGVKQRITEIRETVYNGLSRIGLNHTAESVKSIPILVVPGNVLYKLTKGGTLHGFITTVGHLHTSLQRLGIETQPPKKPDSLVIVTSDVALSLMPPQNMSGFFMHEALHYAIDSFGRIEEWGQRIGIDVANEFINITDDAIMNSRYIREATLAAIRELSDVFEIDKSRHKKVLSAWHKILQKKDVGDGKGAALPGDVQHILGIVCGDKIHPTKLANCIPSAVALDSLAAYYKEEAKTASRASQARYLKMAQMATVMRDFAVRVENQVLHELMAHARRNAIWYDKLPDKQKEEIEETIRAAQFITPFIYNHVKDDVLLLDTSGIDFSAVQHMTGSDRLNQTFYTDPDVFAEDIYQDALMTAMEAVEVILNKALEIGAIDYPKKLKPKDGEAISPKLQVLRENWKKRRIIESAKALAPLIITKQGVNQAIRFILAGGALITPPKLLNDDYGNGEGVEPFIQPSYRFLDDNTKPKWNRLYNEYVRQFAAKFDIPESAVVVGNVVPPWLVSALLPFQATREIVVVDERDKSSGGSNQGQSSQSGSQQGQGQGQGQNQPQQPPPFVPNPSLLQSGAFDDLDSDISGLEDLLNKAWESKQKGPQTEHIDIDGGAGGGMDGIQNPQPPSLNLAPPLPQGVQDLFNGTSVLHVKGDPPSGGGSGSDEGNQRTNPFQRETGGGGGGNQQNNSQNDGLQTPGFDQDRPRSSDNKDSGQGGSGGSGGNESEATDQKRLLQGGGGGGGSDNNADANDQQDQQDNTDASNPQDSTDASSGRQAQTSDQDDDTSDGNSSASTENTDVSEDNKNGDGQPATGNDADDLSDEVRQGLSEFGENFDIIFDDEHAPNGRDISDGRKQDEIDAIVTLSDQDIKEFLLGESGTKGQKNAGAGSRNRGRGSGRFRLQALQLKFASGSPAAEMVADLAEKLRDLVARALGVAPIELEFKKPRKVLKRRGLQMADERPMNNDEDRIVLPQMPVMALIMDTSGSMGQSEQNAAQEIFSMLITTMLEDFSGTTSNAKRGLRNMGIPQSQQQQIHRLIKNAKMPFFITTVDDPVLTDQTAKLENFQGCLLEPITSSSKKKLSGQLNPIGGGGTDMSAAQRLMVALSALINMIGYEDDVKKNAEEIKKAVQRLITIKYGKNVVAGGSLEQAQEETIKTIATLAGIGKGSKGLTRLLKGVNAYNQDSPVAIISVLATDGYTPWATPAEMVKGLKLSGLKTKKGDELPDIFPQTIITLVGTTSKNYQDVVNELKAMWRQQSCGLTWEEFTLFYPFVISHGRAGKKSVIYVLSQTVRNGLTNTITGKKAKEIIEKVRKNCAKG